MVWGCHKFCCSEFYRYRDPLLTNGPDLTNPIHPILSKARFQDDVDYSALEMSLRLASRFLALDKVVRHTVVMTDGVISVLPNSEGRFLKRSPCPKKHPDDNTSDSLEEDEGNDRNDSTEGDEEDKDPNHYYHWRANEILQQAAEHIQFFVDDSNDEDGKAGYAAHREGPWTEAQTSRWNEAQTSRCTPSGVGSDIHIGGSNWTRLKEILNNRAGRLCDRFEIARMIVHELSHGLENLYTGWRQSECFYQDNPISERGFDMEAAIFGGLLDSGGSERLLEARKDEYCPSSPRRKSRTPCMVFYEWPNQAFADMYAWRRFKMGIVQVRSPAKARRVPLTFVESLFSNAFWETVGNSALVVPRAGDFWGVRYFTAQNKGLEGMHPWLSSEEFGKGLAAN